MQSFREPSPPSRPNLSISLPLPADFAVSLGTLPLLVLLVGDRIVTENLIQLGQASEELFRGDRLPTRPLMGNSLATPAIENSTHGEP